MCPAYLGEVAWLRLDTLASLPGTTIHWIHWALWWLFRRRDWSQTVVGWWSPPRCRPKKGSLLDAIAKRESEDWLLAITTDHGGGLVMKQQFFPFFMINNDAKVSIQSYLTIFVLQKDPWLWKALPASAVEFLVFRDYWLNLLKKNTCTTKKSPEVLWKTCPKRFGPPFSRSPVVPLRNNGSKLRTSLKLPCNVKLTQRIWWRVYVL